jgi:hypothetical protein
MRRTSTAASLLAVALLSACAPEPASPAEPGCGPSADTGVIRVRDADELRAALLSAQPGDVLDLADGQYTGHFEGAVAATEQSPIVLRGGGGAVLDGGSDGYALHLSGAHWWTVCGLSVAGGAKGVMLDATSHATLLDLHVSGTGQEAVHLRTGSSDNLVQGLSIDDTGRTDPQYGEGIYVGSAARNWCEYTACAPDASDRNRIVGNTFGSRITAENIDLKEGTTGGVVERNAFDGTGEVAADSWVDVKGNGWLVRDNRGVHAPLDGMQVHVEADGWGQRNAFEGNDLRVDAPGFGFRLAAGAVDTVVACSNRAEGAGSGLASVPCRGE